VRAVIVVSGDVTVFEQHYGSSAEESRNVFSVTKSVMSTLNRVDTVIGPLFAS
jgi:hypothetical protein